MTPITSALRRRPGRPRKFPAPSRAVTVTLPETVLDALAAIHPDTSHAIAQLVKRRQAANERPPAELAVFGRSAVISVRPTPALERRTGVHLVPLPDGRALISFDQPKSISELELLLHDALDDAPLAPADRVVFEGIAGLLKEARRSQHVTLLNRSIIVLESARPAARAKSTTARRPRSRRLAASTP